MVDKVSQLEEIKDKVAVSQPEEIKDKVSQLEEIKLANRRR